MRCACACTGEDLRREQRLIFEILDTVLSSFGPVLDRVDDEIDEVEQDVIQRAREESLQRIFSLKRDLIAMRRVVTPMRDFFARDSDEITHLRGMEPDDSLYFRDLYDTVVHTSELIDSYRDLLSGATDMYLSTVANRQGEISKQLTIIATIFLPLTFLTGFFGQNFAFLTGHIQNADLVVLRARRRAAARLDHRILDLLPPQGLVGLGPVDRGCRPRYVPIGTYQHPVRFGGRLRKARRSGADTSLGPQWVRA